LKFASWLQKVSLTRLAPPLAQNDEFLGVGGLVVRFIVMGFFSVLARFRYVGFLVPLACLAPPYVLFLNYVFLQCNVNIPTLKKK